MRVLALTSFPVEAAATRFRIDQLRPALAQRGIHVDLVPFLREPAYRTLYDIRRVPATVAGVVGGLARRIGDVSKVHRYDAVLVQREMMIAGPPVFEALITGCAGAPMVLDLDDATWVAYDSPTYGRLARLAKWPSKTLTLIDRACVVTCGASAIVDFVEQRGATARLIPPAVDTDAFRPQPKRRESELTVGWIGSHSTWQYLAPLMPMLRSLRAAVPFRLRLVGAGTPPMACGSLPIENVPWSLRREATDFASLDVGLYPLRDDAWARGKSGLKSVQYLACGVPFVASPVGGAAEIGESGVTHLHATSLDEWRECLHRLLTDSALRQRMGQAGRAHALAGYTVERAADQMADALRETVG